MSQTTKHFTGEFISKLNISKQWVSVEISLYDLDVHYERIMVMAESSRGYYTEMYDNKHACMKFQIEDDALLFKEKYLGVS